MKDKKLYRKSHINLFLYSIGSIITKSNHELFQIMGKKPFSCFFHLFQYKSKNTVALLIYIEQLPHFYTYPLDSRGLVVSALDY